MELRYPFAIVFVLIFIIGYFIVFRKKDTLFKTGSKIANTHFLKNSGYYQKKLKQYNILKRLIFVVFGVAIITSSILISRLAITSTTNTELYNRDIFLCLDVSLSVNDLNMELVSSLKDTVKKMKGERFGISIFNSSSVLLVPLTDDYEYVVDILSMIEKSIKAGETGYKNEYGKDYWYIREYVVNGTLEDAPERGSSLIGDGLASCAYSFSNLNEERTRIIIFSTDNELEGRPIATIDQAAEISRNRNIKVFGIGIKNMKDDLRREYKNAVERTGGKYYEHSKTSLNSIVKDIEATSKTLLHSNIETKTVDIPQVPLIILLLSIIGIILISKKVVK